MQETELELYLVERKKNEEYTCLLLEEWVAKALVLPFRQKL